MRTIKHVSTLVLLFAAVLVGTPVANGALFTNSLNASLYSGQRRSTNNFFQQPQYNAPLHRPGTYGIAANANATNNVLVGEIGDTGSLQVPVGETYTTNEFDMTITTNQILVTTNVEANYIIIFDLATIPPANYSASNTFKIRYSLPNTTYLFQDLAGSLTPQVNLDLYGLGFGPSDTNESTFPTNVVFKNDNTPSYGTLIKDNWWTNGTPSANIDTNWPNPAIPSENYRAVSNSTALAAFLQTRPSGPNGRFVFFRVNQDAPFPVDSTTADRNRSFNLKAGTPPQLTIVYEPTLVYITNFTASPTEIAAGGSTLLNWQVIAGATNVTLNPGGLNVTGLTSGSGVGSTNVSPANDTIYTLFASKDGFTLQSSVSVIVNRSYTNTLLDKWTAAETNLDISILPSINTWTSMVGRVASGVGSHVTNATPNGKPAVNCLNQQFLVPGATNPIGGLTEFTIAAVFRADTNNLPLVTTNEWESGASLMTARTGFLTTDLGLAINGDGTALFGGGHPNANLLSSVTNLLDGNFHAIVCEWSAQGELRMYVDANPAVTQTGGSTGGRTSDDLIFFHNQNVLQYFNGAAAEFRFYAERLSAADVTSVLNELSVEYGLGFTIGPTLPPAPLLSASASPAGLNLSWTSQSGFGYTVWRRTSLNSGTWTSITNVTAAGATTAILDPAPLGGSGFYRVSSP